MRLTHGLLALTLLLSACPGDDDDDGFSNGNNGAAGQSGSGAKAGSGAGQQCDMQGCLACFNASKTEGADCADECKGCDDDDSGGSGSGASGSGSSGSSGSKSTSSPTCAKDDDCGISQVCLACGLTDTRGWCFVTKPCNFDDDCGAGKKCGYNVVSGDYACLAAANCESDE